MFVGDEAARRFVVDRQGFCGEGPWEQAGARQGRKV
jgi:hypothetical protein